MDSPLRVEQTGRRLTLTLDDARRQNALSVEMIESIDHALEGAPHDLAALVIQGANGVFSAGADLKSLATLRDAELKEYIQFGQSVFNHLADL